MEIKYKVYKAENIKTGQVYIGSTTSTIEKRQRDHIHKAHTGQGHCFQAAINTYGQESFKWEQIDTAKSVNELASKERKYILKYKAQEQGYNQDAGGGFKKLVYQYDLDGKLINTYNELQDAANAVNVDKRSISAACLGKIKICKNYYWSYDLTDEYSRPEDKRVKEVKQYDSENNMIESFSSISEASKSTGINKSCIAKCCRGERKSAGGYTWKYSS